MEHRATLFYYNSSIAEITFNTVMLRTCGQGIDKPWGPFTNSVVRRSAPMNRPTPTLYDKM